MAMAATAVPAESKIGALRFFDFSLAALLKFLEERKHSLLVAFEFLERHALHSLVVLEGIQHSSLTVHLRYKTAFFDRLAGAESRKLGQVFLLRLLFLRAFGNELAERFHVFAVTVQQVVHPVNFAFRVPVLCQKFKENFGIVTAAVYIQITDTLSHGAFAGLDF